MSDFECLPVGTAARLAELEAEVERLREFEDRAERAEQAVVELSEERDYFKAEVERLRAQQAERKPLTQVQLAALLPGRPSLAFYLYALQVARAVEAAHGIGEGLR